MVEGSYGGKRPNRLVNERSPYLRQHAYNEVDWYPWGEEAFERASREDKPIFLSIGYSSCHWCHVMERESFNDPEIAKILNRHFVSIKVDREERPDIDEIYMRAVQLMSGHGGWPLTVFLTPDLKPFFGGTYFPPVRRLGMPSFKEVLEAVAKAWRERREELIEAGEQLIKAITQGVDAKAQVEQAEVSLDPLELAYEQLVLSFDKDFGGFGGAPKFPMPGYLFLLLRYWRLRGDRTSRMMVERTLDCMHRGGIYDQVGGGFHRYATDRAWLIPHFEKMLYDNAQLLQVYAEAYQAFGEERFREVALDIAEWILREMRSPEGGFYSAIDADSEGEEGKYYVWTKREIIEVFGEDLGRTIARFFGVSDEGNFEMGRSVLHIAGRVEELASELSAPPREALNYVRRRLLEYRERRARPFIDDKIQVSWNGLAISALAYASAVLDRRPLLYEATRAADMILRELFKEGELRRYWRDGPSETKGMLEDYCALGNALVDLFQWGGGSRYLEEASALADATFELFWAGDSFYQTPKNLSDLPVRLVDAYDGPTPSGNSLAVSFLSKLYLLTGYNKYLECALSTVKRFWGAVNSSPTGYVYLISSLGFLSPEHKQLFIACPSGLDGLDLLEVAKRRYEPYMVIALLREGEVSGVMREVSSDKRVLENAPTYYLCRSFSCDLPTRDAGKILELLQRGPINR